MRVLGVQLARALSVVIVGVAVVCSCVTDRSNASAAPAGRVFYAAPISTSCDPSEAGSGTLDDPWTNPYHALTRGGLRPGDTLQLRGGTYWNKYFGYMRDDNEQDRYRSCDDDQQSGSRRDGTHTVLPLFLAGEPGNEIVVENYPGETVIIVGTNARMESATWRECSAGTYMTSDFNVGSARTPQVWVDPTGPEDAGTRLRWNSDNSGSCSLAPGEFAYTSDRDLYIRLPDSSAPSDHEIHLTCQGGDCATHPIHADAGAEYMTVRRNPEGGRFFVKYGYYNGYVTANAHHLTFDGIDWVAGGGRDYGFCFRIHDGDYVTVKNGSCHETMAQGIGYYGGLSDVGLTITHNVIENMEIYDTGRAWVDGGGIGNNLGMGIILKNCSDCVARDNIVHNTYRGGIQVNHSTDGCPSGPCDVLNTLVERNEIYGFCHFRRDNDAMAGQSDCGAIIFRNAPTNGDIRGIIVRNNMIHGTYSTPFSNDASPHGIYTDGIIPDAVIVNNSLNNIPGACINVEPNSRPVTIIGNAMDNCSTGSAGCNGQACALFVDRSTSHKTAFNSYWADDDDVQVVKRNWSLPITRDRVVDRWEPTAVQAPPNFRSASDLHLTEQSDLIDAQDCATAPEKDFDNEDRPYARQCDIGADEYHP